MKETESGKFELTGKTILLVLVCAIFLPIVVVMLMNSTSSFSPSAAISLLESRGYFVASADEYDTLNAKLDALKVAADLAVANAEAAVIAANNAVDAAQLAADKVDLFNTAPRFLYPSTTQITCTLVAGNTGVFSDWTLITDSTGGNFSAQFSASTGYIVDMQIYDHSAVDKLYLVEITYGASKTPLGTAMWHTSFIDNVDIKSVLVPAGETVYYRMMCSGANGATAKVGFRYIYE